MAYPSSSTLPLSALRPRFELAPDRTALPAPAREDSLCRSPGRRRARTDGMNGGERLTDGREDLKLVRAAIGGDQLARRRLIARLACIPAMLRARRKLHGLRLPEEELDDLTQDIVLAVWRNLADFDGRGDLEGWVYGFVRHLGYKAIGSRARRATCAPLEGNAEPVADPGEPSAEEALLLHVEAALDELDEPSASIIRWRHHRGCSFEEIARRLETPINTVKTRYYRGLRRLRERLQGRWQEELS